MIELKVSVFALQTPLVAAVHEGFLAEEGLGVSYVRTTSSAEQMQQLLAGDVDIVQTAADNIIGLAADGDVGVRIFAVLDLGIDQFVVTRAGVETWSALRGGRVSVDSATSGYAFVLYSLLADLGIDRDEYEVVPVGGPLRRFELLTAGSVDVGLLNPHLAARAQVAGARVLARAADHIPGYPNLTFAACSSALREGRPVLTAFSRAMERALRWAHETPDETRAAQMLAAARDCGEDEALALFRSERSLREVVRPSAEQARASVALVAALRDRMGGGQVPEEHYVDLVDARREARREA